MNPVLPALAVLLALSLSVGAEDALRVVKTAAAPDSIDFQRGRHGPTLARVLATATHGRPYVHPLRSPGGKGVLTEFSPGHHKHQTGLYWGPTRVNGRYYFQKKNQEGEGQPAKWVDLAMQIDGMDQMAHIAIIDHPQNAGHPALWRIDGQFGVGPALARCGDITIPKGDSKTVRYRLVVYQGDFDRELIEKEQAAFRAP